jgi:hypothetical protein
MKPTVKAFGLGAFCGLFLGIMLVSLVRQPNPSSPTQTTAINPNLKYKGDEYHQLACKEWESFKVDSVPNTPEAFRERIDKIDALGAASMYRPIRDATLLLRAVFNISPEKRKLKNDFLEVAVDRMNDACRDLPIADSGTKR